MIFSSKHFIVKLDLLVDIQPFKYLYLFIEQISWNIIFGISQIHTKKRNRLEQKRLNDLVFVKFNARLRLKRADKNRDPIAINDRDEDRFSESEWKAPASKCGSNVIPQNEEVFPGEGLTWGQVGQATGATSQTRKNMRRKATMQTQGTKTRTINDVEFESSESEVDE